MKVYGFIYKLINKINGRVYIGLTTKSIKNRLKGHIKTSKSKYNHPLYNAIRFYGIENFEIEQICECYTKEELGQKEKEYILLYQSIDHKFGYNISLGGFDNCFIVKQNNDKIELSNVSKEYHKNNPGSQVGENNSNSKLKKEDVEYIRENPDDLKILELSKKFDVTQSCIIKIRKNKLWVINDIEKYNKEENLKTSMNRRGLAKINWYDVVDIRENINNLSTSEMAKKYNIDTRTICSIYKNKSWKEEDYPPEIKELAKDIKVNRVFDKRGTYNISAENMKYGEKSHNAKLKWEQVVYIRQNPDKLTYVELSKKFNVSIGCINRIMNNKRWKPENYPPHIKALIEEYKNN